LSNTAEGEEIDIANFFALTEVLHLHQTLVDEALEAVVELTGTQSHTLRDFALGEIGVDLQQMQHPKGGVFFLLATTIRHVCRNVPAFATLKPYCVTVSKRDMHQVWRINVCSNYDDSTVKHLEIFVDCTSSLAMTNEGAQ
jgi:hypothetical protein